MTEKQRQFAAKLRELIRESRWLPRDANRRVIELLDEARKRIAGEMYGINPESYQAAQLRALRRSIDEAFDYFRGRATTVVNGVQEKEFRLGQAMINEPAEIAVDVLPFGRVSRKTLELAQDYAADLITGLSRDAAAKVNAAIQRAFLGGQPLTEIIAQLGRAIGGKEFSGLFSPVGRRATIIATNEILRVHSMAAQARLEDLAERLPEGQKPQKQWHWLNVGQEPRMTHQEISGQVKPVNEPFEVPNMVTGDIEELMFPRDPAGSPENTINCHCMLKPYFDWDAMVKPQPGARQWLRDLGISVEVTH